MDRAATELAALPDHAEFSNEAMDRLEEVRHQAIRLKTEVEAIFDLLAER